MKKLLLLFVIFISANLFGQNITNTLGTGGNLYVKDASTTFLTLQQSNGYLGLGTSPNQQLEITEPTPYDQYLMAQVHIGRNELRQRGEPVEVQPTPLRLLLYLAENRG